LAGNERARRFYEKVGCIPVADDVVGQRTGNVLVSMHIVGI
jgi:hypothetical protein